MTVTLTTARVKYPAGKIIETKYGERVNAVFTLQDGSEATIWGNVGSDISRLKKNDVVQLADLENNGKWKVVSLPESPTPVKPQSEPVTMDEPKKREVAVYVQEMAKLYGFCFSQATAIAPETLPPEAVKDIASTLFITAQRKFNL